MQDRGQTAAVAVRSAATLGVSLAAVALLGFIAAASWAGDIPTPRSAVTHHRWEANGVRVRYSAWVEDNFVNDSHGRPGASIITVAYTRDGVADPARRPVIFAFNGGPGAAGSMINFSALGPVRLVHVQRARGPEPYVQNGPRGRRSERFVDNPDSLLDVADMVFVDPVGTGFSRAFPGENPTQWYSGGSDAAAVTQAIDAWLTRHHRWASPRYLIGESYGTDRAAMMLAKDERLRFDGVVLIALAVPAQGHLIPYVTSLPTMAAGAWYHRKIYRDGRTVEQVFHQAAQFAGTDYLTALFRGSTLPGADRERIAQRLSQLTGLPASLIEAKDLRIDKNTYMFNLLKDQHLRTGLLDVRVTAPLVANEQGAIDDPALGVLPKKLIGSKHLTAASLGILTNPKIGTYLKRVLHFPTHQQYYSINFIANSKWKYDRRFDAVAAVSAAMKAQPRLRLMWVQGLYDLTCPADLARYTIDQDGIPANRLTAVLLPGPHSAYLTPDTRPIFTAALRKFVGQ
ncbi:MAG: S10 family serine carboxypeptidase-like protein [Steroidobacteraceae bacterium]